MASQGDTSPAPVQTPMHSHAAPLRFQGDFYMTGVVSVAGVASLSSDADCTICMETLVNDVVKMTACDHCFQTVCILSWFDQSAPHHGKQKGRCLNSRHELYEPDPRLTQLDIDAHRQGQNIHSEASRRIRELESLRDQMQLIHETMMSRRQPQFHTGSTRDSLEITSDRQRRQLQTIVGTNAPSAPSAPNGRSESCNTDVLPGLRARVAAVEARIRASSSHAPRPETQVNQAS